MALIVRVVKVAVVTMTTVAYLIGLKYLLEEALAVQVARRERRAPIADWPHTRYPSKATAPMPVEEHAAALAAGLEHRTDSLAVLRLRR